jgi:hypothetical protein
MPKITQLVLSLQSKPGVLATVARTLAAAGVNITGLCAAETAGRGKVRLTVSDPARARAALQAAKLRAAEETALVVMLDDQPGALAGVAERLARAKINIKCAYASTAGGGRAAVVLTVSNADRALAALG